MPCQQLFKFTAVSYSINKLILNTMIWLDKFSCRRSDLVITVGRDLVETINKRFEDRKIPKTVFSNNWINETKDFPLWGEAKLASPIKFLLNHSYGYGEEDY